MYDDADIVNGLRALKNWTDKYDSYCPMCGYEGLHTGREEAIKQIKVLLNAMESSRSKRCGAKRRGIL